MFADWVKETTTTTGTGTLTLAAVTNFPRFGNAFQDGEPVQYAILDSAGNPVEAGIGHYVASNQLARDYAEAKYVSGTLTVPAGTFANLGTDNTGTPWTVIATPIAHGIMPTMPGTNAGAANKFIWPWPYSVPFAGGNSKVLTANTPLVIAGRFDYAHEISALACQVHTAAGVGGTDRIQIGLYPVNADGSPGKLLVRSGDMDPSTTGTKTASPSGGSNVLVPPGWYYIAVASSAAPGIGAFNAGSSSNLQGPTPLGCNGSPDPNGFCSASALTGGWTALPASLGTFAGFNGIGVDFPPCLFLVSA